MYLHKKAIICGLDQTRDLNGKMFEAYQKNIFSSYYYDFNNFPTMDLKRKQMLTECENDNTLLRVSST